MRLQLLYRVGVASLVAIVASTALANSVSVAMPSFVGSPAVSETSCSKADATALVNQHDLNSFLLQDPVRQVLCGPFTGAGSEAMVVAIAAPTCWGVQRWAVFRFSAGTWQLVLDRHEFVFVPLVAVGGDIRVSSPIFRAGDPRCLPSGGKRARTWHWNGTRFVAGPWKRVTAPSSSGSRTVRLYQFASPSRNIACVLGDEERAYCLTVKPPRSVSLSPNGRLRICNGPVCIGSGRFGEVPTLPYGSQDLYAGYLCRSKTTGVTCVYAKSGKGFLINRSGVTKIG